LTSASRVKDYASCWEKEVSTKILARIFGMQEKPVRLFPAQEGGSGTSLEPRH
jgi:hypothetical protein